MTIASRRIDTSPTVPAALMRTPLRMSHSVGHMRSCARSLGRPPREYAGGMDGGGNMPKQDDILPQKCAREFQNDRAREAAT